MTPRLQEVSGEDPILVLDSPARFGAETNILDVNDAQAYIALLYVVNGIAEDQYNSVRGSLPASWRGVTC